MKKLLLISVACLAAATVSAEPEASDRRALADAMFSRKAYKGAAEEYWGILRDYPDGAETAYVTYRLGEALRFLGDSDGAIAAYGKVISMPGNDYTANARVQCALLMLSAGRAAEAEKLFDGILASEADGVLRETALYGRADALNRLGRTEGAVAALESFISGFPESAARPSAVSLLASICASSPEPDGRPRDAARAISLYGSLAENAADAETEIRALKAVVSVAGRADDCKTAADAARKLFLKHPQTKSDAGLALCAAYAFLKTESCTEAIELCDAVSPSAGAADAEEFAFCRAQALFRLSRYGDAVAEFMKIAEGNGARAKAARLKAANALYCAGEYARCRETVRPLLAESGELRMNALHVSAGAAMALGDLDGQLDDYNRLASEYKDSKYAPEAIYNLACVLSKKGDHSRSARAFAHLQQRYPDDERVENACYSAAKEFQSAKMLPEAIERWRVFVRDFPGSARLDSALYNEALALHETENLTEALAAVDALLSKFPQSAYKAAALCVRGGIKSRLNDDAAAVAAYRGAIEAAGDDAAVRDGASFNLAVLLRKTGNDAEAADIFARLLSGGVGVGLSSEQLEWLIVFELGRGDNETAVKAARTMIEKAGDDANRQKAWTLAGRSERAAGRAREAEDAYRTASEMAVNTIYKVEASLRLAELLLARGDNDGAEAGFMRTLELCGGNEQLASSRIEARVGLGETCLAKGDKEEAVKQMRFVCVFEPDREISRRVFPKLINLLEELGRGEEADEMRGAFETGDGK